MGSPSCIMFWSVKYTHLHAKDETSKLLTWISFFYIKLLVYNTFCSQFDTNLAPIPWTMMMKSNQLFRFYKEREKILIQQNDNRKLGKVGPCLIKGCFIKSFKIVIIYSSIDLFAHKIFIFLISQAFLQRNFRFLTPDDATNIKKGHWER